MTQEHDPAPHNGSSDPTALSTQALLREIYNLRELLTAQISGLEAQVLTRFEGMDKAIGLLQAQADKVPSEVDLKTGALKELIFAKFAAIDTQFAERDTRTAETANLNKLAIDAALQAQKEAAGKSEEGFTKQIEKLDDLITTKTGALGTEIRANMATLDSKATASKERLDNMTGHSSGIDAAWAFLVGAVVLAGAAVAIVISLQGG